MFQKARAAQRQLKVGAMATKVVVDMPLCGYKTIITAEKSSSFVKIKIESDCEHVRRFNEALDEIRMEDVTHFSSSRIIEVAGDYLTPSCLVPCGIMNAARIEFGLISKKRALKSKELKIVFEG